MPEYHNPQQEPGMERRLLLVFALTFIVLLIFQPLLTKYIKPSAPASQQARTAAPPANPAAAAPSGPAAPAQAKSAATAATKQASSETETVIENDLYKITFSNRGGQVKSWVLKQYSDDAGKPLELVKPAAAEQFGYPLSLYTYDEGLRKKLASALYVVTLSLPADSIGATLGEDSTHPKPGETAVRRPPADITFEYADQQTSVRKSFHFDESYVVKLDTRVEQDGVAVQAFPAWPGGIGDQTTPASYASGRVAYQYGDKTERIALKKVSGGATIPGPFQWAGAMDQYFGAVFLPSDPTNARLVTFRNTIQAPVQPGSQQTRAEDVLGAAVGSAGSSTSERMFVGPKNLAVLETIQTTAVAGVPTPDLRQLVDFGFWNLIARPLFLWLRWTHQHGVSNWGWAIIVQTVIINLVLFPLRLTSMKSALKMQKVQPQINAVKKKYEKFSMRDPRRQEMNQEIQALFKREGVNPAGGCLPMLIQFPFLIAFYTMLGVAIELRHAQWFWLRDLSAADPTHILPVGIILTTLFVQKMTPQAGMDPAQQRIMTLFMPVMLGVISWSLSAGLGLYWVVGNFIAIAQQYFMNRTRLGREMREEAEKRARKRKD